MICLITNWMNNVCFDSDFKHFQSMEDASEYLDDCLRYEICKDCDECHGQGTIIQHHGYQDNIRKIINNCPVFAQRLEEEREKYWIEEYDESIVRVGRR